MKPTTGISIFLSFVFLFIISGNSHSQAIAEGYNDITTLAGQGWVMQNNSSPIGVTNWFQGNATVFAAYNGATTSYIGANFNNAAGTGTISNWLMTPNRTFKNGDVISFFTRCSPDNTYPDRLQLRLSTNGVSVNVGTLATDVGDFTTLLLEINPTQVISVYPYTAWTQYTTVISGLAAPTSGRAAFRYFVTNSGPTGVNGDYIGIDNFIYTPYVCPTFTLTPNGALAVGTAGTVYSNTLTQSGALGTPTFTLTGGTLPTGLTISAAGVISGTPTATGSFSFSITVTDASGCSGVGNYSIVINCPADPTSIAAFPTLCSNDAPYTLVEGLPAGGIYSGTGVTAGIFDPSNGSQLITYDYTDVYSCAYSASTTIAVNAAPIVTFTSSVTEACVTGSTFALDGGSPAGGTYSGTGVTAGMFDPASAGLGIHTVTYIFTDANSCTGSETSEITVGDCLGLNELTAHGITIYPNPGNGNYTIDLKSDQVITDLKIIDLSGKLIENSLISLKDESVLISIEHVENGAYILIGKLNEKAFKVRLIKE